VTPLLLGLLGLALAGPVPALLGRSGWLLAVPRAGVVLWQSLSLAASLAILVPGSQSRCRSAWAGTPRCVEPPPPSCWRSPR
jgi:hypothetical protein